MEVKEYDRKMRMLKAIKELLEGENFEPIIEAIKQEEEKLIVSQIPF